MDKGNNVAVLNKCDYFKKLDKILLDKTWFEKIQFNDNCKTPKTCKLAPRIIQENKVTYYYRNYIKHLVDKKITIEFVHKVLSLVSYVVWLKLTKTTSG